jgi:predicted RNase H-like nuclease
VLPARLSGVTVVVDEPFVVATLRDVLEYKPSFDSAAIDVPIGFPDEPAGPFRAAELEAREMLGWPRFAAIHPVPSRAALHATTFAEANALEPWLTRYDWYRFRWLRESLDEIQPFHQRHWFSSHPELSFLSLNGDQPVRSSPYQTDGIAERRALLRERLPGVEDVVVQTTPDGAAPVHLLRAAGLLWTARRSLARAASRLPIDMAWNDAGLRIELLR